MREFGQAGQYESNNFVTTVPNFNNQPIRNNGFDNFNAAPSVESYSEYQTQRNGLEVRGFFCFNERTNDLISHIDHEQFQYTPSTIPATQNYHPNQNGFQQELYYEDGKDLHYSSQTGSHSTDFSYGSSNSGPNQSQSR